MDHVSPNSTSSLSGCSSYPNSPPSPPSPQPQLRTDETFSLQNRRLRLRNAGFRGAHFPARKISGHISHWRNLSGSSQVEAEKENSRAPSVQDFQSNDLSSLRVKANMLQEIYNSSTRNESHRLPRPSVITVFQDHHPESEDEEHPFPSTPSRPFGVSSRSPSLSSADESDLESSMKSGERSFSGTSPSPLRTQTKANKTHVADHEATKYIGHLEVQLAAAQSQLTSVQSLTTGPQISRLKSLHTELKAVKQELSEWESQFETRVKEEVAERTEVESKLRAKILLLEGQVEAGLRRIRELEHQNGIQAHKLRSIEALKSTNRGLERRVDVLTGLLAQSPTRTQQRSPGHGYDVASPSRSPGPRLPRPRSMLSPSARTEGFFEGLVTPGTDSWKDAGELRGPIETTSTSHQQRPHNDTKLIAMSASTNSILGKSASSQASIIQSQQSSISSHSSSTSSQPGSPISSPDRQSKSQSRLRSMRRFPSGTCTLKPLILPATTVAASDTCPSLPIDSAGTVAQHCALYDLRKAFPNRSTDNVPSEVNTESYPGVLSETLKALEGQSSYCGTFEEAISGFVMGVSDSLLLLKSYQGEPNLDDSSPFDLRGDLITKTEDNILPSSPHTQEFESLLIQPVRNSKNQDGCPPSGLSTPVRHQQIARCNYPIDMQNDDDSSHLLNRLAGGSVVGIFSNYSSYLTEFRFHLTTIGGRIIRNTRRRSVGRFRKFSWWVIGLLLGSQTRDTLSKVSLTPTADNFHTCGGTTRALETPGLRPQQEPGLSHSCELETAIHPCNLNWAEKPGMLGDGLSDLSGRVPPRYTSFGYSLRLWAKFSLALVLAIGIAVRHGPESLLEDDSRPKRVSPVSTGRPLNQSGSSGLFD